MSKFNYKNGKSGFALFTDLHKNKQSFLSSARTKDCYEIYVLDKAKGSIKLNGQTITIKDASVFFVAPSQRKSFELDSSKTKGYHLVFDNDFLSNFFNDKLIAHRLHYFYNAQFPQFLKIESKEFSFIESILQEITSEIKNQQSDSSQLIRSLLFILVTKLNKLYAKKYKLSSETNGDPIIYKFKDLVERNIRKFHRVDDYCDILQIQRNKLNRIVKTHFGTTAKETIHLRMLQEIKIELLYSNKTVVQIAKELNFSEPNNMTRFFNRLEGMPPSIFREQYMKNKQTTTH